MTMDDLVPGRYISLFFTDIGVFTPNVVAAELADMFEWCKRGEMSVNKWSI